MTTLREAFKAALTSDAELAAILTGGIFDVDDLGRQGLTPKNAPRAADGVTLLPVAVIRWSTSAPYMLRNAERRFVQVWFYDDRGAATIDRAQRRVKGLLHRARLGPTAGDALGLNFVHWVGDVNGLAAEELQDASAAYSRYMVDLTRR